MKVIISKLPETFDEFTKMETSDFTKPENTCAMLLCALELYVKNSGEGKKAIDLLRGPRPMTGYDVSFLNDRLRGKTYLPLAYFEGASPENSYEPHIPYELEVMPSSRPQDAEEGYIKLFLKTAGADSPRPLTLRKKGNEWCLWEYSSILTGIRMPKAEDPWA